MTANRRKCLRINEKVLPILDECRSLLADLVKFGGQDPAWDWSLTVRGVRDCARGLHQKLMEVADELGAVLGEPRRGRPRKPVLVAGVLADWRKGNTLSEMAEDHRVSRRTIGRIIKAEQERQKEADRRKEQERIRKQTEKLEAILYGPAPEPEPGEPLEQCEPPEGLDVPDPMEDYFDRRKEPDEPGYSPDYAATLHDSTRPRMRDRGDDDRPGRQRRKR